MLWCCSLTFAASAALFFNVSQNPPTLCSKSLPRLGSCALLCAPSTNPWTVEPMRASCIFDPSVDTLRRGVSDDD